MEIETSDILNKIVTFHTILNPQFNKTLETMEFFVPLKMSHTYVSYMYIFIDFNAFRLGAQS